MQNGYKVYWTENAFNELRQTIEYVENNFSEKEVAFLTKEIERTVSLISRNPAVFPVSAFQQNIRKAVVAKYNSMYYQQNEKTIEILSFFSNRQNPDKIRIK